MSETDVCGTPATATDPRVEELISVVRDGYKKTRFAIGNLPDEQVLKITASLAASIEPAESGRKYSGNPEKALSFLRESLQCINDARRIMGLDSIRDPTTPQQPKRKRGFHRP